MSRGMAHSTEEEPEIRLEKKKTRAARKETRTNSAENMKLFAWMSLTKLYVCVLVGSV